MASLVSASASQSLSPASASANSSLARPLAAEASKRDASFAVAWAQGAGPCHLGASVSWKGCSLSDWQSNSATSFVESWRTGGGTAERDESAGALPLAPGLAPVLVRSTHKASKGRRGHKTKAAHQHHQQQAKQEQAPAARQPGLPSALALGGKASSGGAVGSSLPPAGALSLGVPVSLLEEELLAKQVAPDTPPPADPVPAIAAGLEKPAGSALYAATAEGAPQEQARGAQAMRYDFVVVGSGIAGLRFALDVAKQGTVAVVTKAERQEGSTNYAQGGVSAVLDPRDSVENHIRDTIVAGAYLNDEEVVEVVCREGPERVKELMEMGASFDRGEDGRLQLAREGGHSHHRIVHAADVTGREIQRALLVAAQRDPNIALFEHHFVVDLLTTQDPDGAPQCYGVDALDVRSGQVLRFLAGSTLLASGGAGHVYPSTTNPPVATGDGVALAQRAHAVISNMEFVQFHPTALADAGLPLPPAAPRPNAFLITEAVRGAGGVLYNQAGERFMPQYDARGELAPRDVVARSIDDQLKRRGEQFVWLDISHKPRDEILAHFPNIAEECLRCGVDITKQPIPVVPAAHYMCGGVQTGLHGETSVKGLWAAGEVACTGLHGANRLASNSLLEALVFAQRAVGPATAYALQQREEGAAGGVLQRAAGHALAAHAPGQVQSLLEALPRAKGVSETDPRAVAAARITKKYKEQVQASMWEHVGIVRSTERLLVAQRKLVKAAKEWKGELVSVAGLASGAVTVEVCEMRNLLAVAMLIVQSALQRQESRGLHFTTDFPESLESQRLPTVLSPPVVAPTPEASKRALDAKARGTRSVAASRAQAAAPCQDSAVVKKRLT